MANFFVSLARFSAQDGGRAMQAYGEDMVLGFVDAEGQGDRGTEYDLKLISAPMLLSRVIIFNWNNSMQKDKILDELSYQGPQVKGTLRQVRRPALTP